MKTKLLTALLAFTAVCTTKADLLFWQANAEAPVAYDYASIYYTDGAGNKQSLNNYAYNSNFSAPFVEKGSVAAADIDISGISDLSTLALYVELYNASLGTVVATSKDPISYDDVKAHISSNQFDENWSPNTSPAYSLKGVTFVPEPTSGILMLLGMGLLGLKRKRA